MSASEIPPASGAQALGRVRLASRRTLREIALTPETGVGQAYVEGRLQVEGDLASLIETAYRAGDPTPSRLRTLLTPISWVFRHASTGRARENIRRHYDLGNDFYRLWLDERMQYTCAFFPSSDASLEAAQLAKLERVCRELALRPDERVIEAGCGWGGLALHMAEHHGVRVRAFNISAEQVAFARERARERGLQDRIEFVEDDYRNITGESDVFVSVGMLEHVGRDSYLTLSSLIERTLAAQGRGLIHSIGRTRAQHMNAWLEQNIFPDAYIPSLREMMHVLEPHRFAVLDVENLRQPIRACLGRRPAVLPAGECRSPGNPRSERRTRPTEAIPVPPHLPQQNGEARRPLRAGVSGRRTIRGLFQTDHAHG